jgi:hypothetical protein
MLTEEISRPSKNIFFEGRDATRQKLVSRVYEMCELLGSHPRAELARIREVLREIRALHQASRIDHGLLSLVLHNMVRDLSGTGGQFEATYYAHQLQAAADQIRTK